MDSEKMMPIFSIILPTYNRAYVLWRAILSVLAQTEERWELIVVDDGSTDATPLLLEEFRDPRIRVLTTENRGPSAARNLGARHTNAPYLAYLDSDNIWHREFLSTMREAIESHPNKVLWYCGQHTEMWRRSQDGSWTLESDEDEPRAQYSVADVLELKGADTNCIVHARSVLAEIGGWDEDCFWLEDWDFFARTILRFPEGVHWIPKILVEYRQVHGYETDGMCARIVRNPERNRDAWRYLIEKWRHQPGFEATAERLIAKHLKCKLTA